MAEITRDDVRAQMEWLLLHAEDDVESFERLGFGTALLDEKRKLVAIYRMARNAFLARVPDAP